jgi:manganese-dependent inorganic pyrophosphatase
MEEPLVNFMCRNNLVVFDEDELLSEVQQTMLDTRYRNYPAVDEEGRFLGLIGRYHLLGAKKKEVILVDHNEKNQTIAGIEEAKILEIIDHHRLADLETSEPIMVRNEPVGSTCTIISKIYRENGLKPETSTAGILCAAILSDTLIFKSPTSTATDKKEAEWLAQIAAIELQNFGEEMFRAVSSLEGSSPREIILEDFKDFNFSGKKVGIGQIEVLSTDAIAVERVRLLKELEKIQQEGEYDLVALMVTDLSRQGTELLFAGPGSKIVERAFNVAKEAKSVFLPGVMSRKKEIIPPLRRFFEGA